jgi:hypothetical protein
MVAAPLVSLAAVVGASGTPAQASTPRNPISCVYDYGSNSAPIECVSSACGPGLLIREGNGGQVTMHCWLDSTTVTGNYTSNRWFEVYAPGLPGLWLIHSSFVYNQITVGHC